MRSSPYFSSLVVALLASALAPRAASSACCELVKTDADPPAVEVRACASDAAGACTTPLFEGALTQGESASVCTSQATIVYQTLDTETQTYAPPIEARCDEGGRVEL